jgi:GNAT superfamily N-acetyltransferase
VTDWWDAAPVADKGDWWKAAPVAGAAPDPAPKPAPQSQPNLVERAMLLATAPGRGIIERAGVGGGIRRGATGLLASGLHAASDFIDQTVQSGPRAIMEALTGGTGAFVDPLGARGSARESAAVAREINTDRAEAAARIGARPSLADVLDDPTTALERGAAYYANQAAESAPAMAAAIATRNPELAAAALGATTGAQSYTDLRNEGVGRADAARAAALTGAVEAAGESFGLPAVIGAGRGGLAGLIAAALKEGAQEAPVAVAQRNIEDQAAGKQTPVAQQLMEALDAAVVGAGIGAGGQVATNPTLAAEPAPAAPVDIVEVLRAAQATRDAATPPPAPATPPPAEAAAPRQGVPEPAAGATAPPVAPVEAPAAPEAVDVPDGATAAPAAPPVRPGTDRVVTAKTKGGQFTLRDAEAPAGADFSEFGQVRQVEAYDGDKKIGTLTYANDGTPPTIEVDEAYRRKGVGTAMLKLAKEQGGVLGDAEGGMRGKASEYRTPDGQAFRSAADESTVELTPLEETAQAPAPVADVPAEAAAPVAAPSGRVTSTKNEVTDIERAERGEEQLTSGATITNDATIAKARAELAAKPERGAEVVAKLRNAGTEGISLDDEAILLAEKVRLQAARDAAADRASDPNATDEQRAVAQAEWSEAESQINSLDEAARAGGAEWGRLGQFRQQLIRDDYTFEALERKERAREGRPLTMQESAALKVEADKFAALQAKLDETQAALAEAQASAGAKQTFDDLLTEMKTALGTERKKSRPALATLKARADAAREKLAALEPAKNTKRQGGSAIDPRAFVYLAEIGAYHVANGAVNFADWASKMVADVGAAFKSLPLPGKRAVFKASKEQASAAAAKPAKVRAAEAVLADIDPANLTHKDVYDLAAAKVAAGMKGENEVMAAVTEDLKAKFPEITERDVRRLFSEYGKAKYPSKDADKKKLRELRALVQLQESIDRLEEGLQPLRSGLQRDKATLEVREKRAQLNELLKKLVDRTAPENVEALNNARAENLRKQIADLERQLETGERRQKADPIEPNEEVRRLREVRDDLKAQLKAIDDAGKPVRTPDQRYQETRARSIAKQIAEVRARIAADDYERRAPRVPKQLDEANTKAAFELAKAKQEFARKQFEAEMKKRSPLAKAFSHTLDGVNLARAIMTSLDLSGVFRQGGFISFGRPALAAKSIVPMLKAFASEGAEFKVADDIAKRENAPLYKKYGLEITDPHSLHLTKMEEAYMSRFVSKLPKWVGGGLIRGSSRAYTTFLNKLRADTFDALAATLAKSQELTPEEGKAIANYINVATGRGKIGTSANGGVGLNTVFFAPRLVASRFNLLGGQPLYGGTNRTRKLIAQEYARFATGIGMVFALAALAHDDEDGEMVETDPRSRNFLKIKVGDNTYIDPMTGLSQVTVFLTQLLSGEKKTNKGELRPVREKYRWSDLTGAAVPPDYNKPRITDEGGFDIIGRFARTKLAPVPGAIANIVDGKNLVGEEATIPGEAASLVTPLSIRDIKGIMEEHGIGTGAAIFALNLLGFGVQYRDPKKKEDENAGK